MDGKDRSQRQALSLSRPMLAVSILLGDTMKHEIFGRRKSLHRSNYMAALVCLLAAWTMPSHSAKAMGAFAAGIPDDVATQGAPFGEGHNYSTQEGAEARALLECRKQVGVPASTLALCKIIAHFNNQCVAVSMDPQAGTPGFGWAIGANADAANNQALANCRQTAGPNRAAYCVISLAQCDTATPAQK